MKAIKTSGWGTGTRLVVGEASVPVPGDGEVLVKVYATSVNPKDWKLNYHAAMLATPLGTRRLPPLFGDDLAGVVVSTGPGVRDFRPGDAVFGMDMRLRTAALAEYAVIDQRRIALKPPRLSFLEAAAVPLAAQTALQGLRKAGAREGSKVLVIGASGGVGTFTVQIAKALGCHVTAVCSGGNAVLVRTLGADAIIDYTEGDFRPTAGIFDVVFDVTSYETPASCKALLGPEGYFISTAGHGKAVAATLLSGSSRAALVRVESYRDDLETISRWIEEGKVYSVVDSIFSLENAQRAYDLSRSGRARGKIVIEVSPPDVEPDVAGAEAYASAEPGESPGVA